MGSHSDKLASFVAVAKAGSVRRAARRLYLAPSTVSAHLRELEAEMGVSLFQRHARNLTLSPAGRRFLPHAEQILNSVHSAQEDLWSFQQGLDQHLVLGASPIVATTTLPRLLRQFVSQHPSVSVTVRVEGSDVLVQAIQRREVDVAFARVPGQGDIEDYELDRERVILVANNLGADHDSPPLTIDEVLPRLPLLVDTHPGYWPDLLTSLRRRRLVGRTISVQRTDVAKSLIEEGLGVSFLPYSSVRRELLEGRLTQVQTGRLELPSAATHLLIPLRDRHALCHDLVQLVKHFWGASVHKL